MANYAIIETGGKQYKVAQGDVLFIEKLHAEENDVVNFNVIAISGDNGLVAGAPFVDGATVTGKVEKHGKSRKILVYKYKAKKNYRRKQGHRQPYTRVVIDSIKA